jgi:hypothetical protein
MQFFIQFWSQVTMVQVQGTQHDTGARQRGKCASVTVSIGSLGATQGCGHVGVGLRTSEPWMLVDAGGCQ